MKLNYIENTHELLKDFTYYHLIVFPEKHKSGYSYPIAYKRLKNAEKKYTQLIDSKKYVCVVLRKCEIVYRCLPDTCIEIDGALKQYSID